MTIMAYIVAMDIQTKGKTCRIRIAYNMDILVCDFDVDVSSRSLT
jgi:hypothetical protein